MPKGIPYIVGNEAAERFSYYGLLAILAVFLTEHLRDVSGNLAPLDENTANEWQHNFMAAVYFFPIVGAILSDWLFGKYRMIISVSILYVVGHAMLALMDFPTDHRNRSEDSADAGPDADCDRRRRHQALRVGARRRSIRRAEQAFDHQGLRLVLLLGQSRRDDFDAAHAVAARSTTVRAGPSACRASRWRLASLVFWLGRYKFVHIPPGGTGFFHETFSDDGLRAIANLIPLYLFIIPFWCLFDQTHSSWVHQAKHMGMRTSSFRTRSEGAAGADADGQPDL